MGADPGTLARYVRFGPFRLDLRSNELHQDGRRLKVPDQSIEILKALLEVRGDLVTRDELRQRLWPDDTFVDFEHSLNAAVRRLREALGDSAETPQFIETLPRRGYRFIGKIEAGAARDASSVARPLSGAHWAAVFATVAALATLGGVAALISRSAAPSPIRPSVEFTQLTAAAGIELHPTLSPDGQWVAYAAGPKGSRDILLQRIGPGVPAPINLTPDSPGDDSEPAFSPDGELIAFRSEREGGGIFLINRDGVFVKRLTRDGFSPAWSPDGKDIFYSTETLTDPEQRGSMSELWKVEVATERTARVLDTDCMHPAVSPHGHRIACWAVPMPNTEEENRLTAGQRDLLTVRMDGTDRRYATLDVATDWSPVWSPEGGHLYFASDRGGTMNLWRIAIDELSGETRGQPEPVTTPAPWLGHLARSARGHLAYTAYIHRSSVYRIAFDPMKERVEGEAVRLTSDTRSWGRAEPSPDGTHVVMWSEFRQQDIYIMRADGSGLRALTNDPARDRAPRWSPDGRQIAFYSNRDGNYQTWTIAPDGSGLRQITRLSRSIQPLWSPDGLRLLVGDHIGRRNHVVALDTRLVTRPLDTLPEHPDPTGHFSARSWSRDGRIAGIVHARLWIYDLSTKRYTDLTAITPGDAGPVCLNDDRRLLYPLNGSIALVDAGTGRTKNILTIEGASLAAPTLSSDNRHLYFLRRSTDADIWLMTFK